MVAKLCASSKFHVHNSVTWPFFLFFFKKYLTICVHPEDAICGDRSSLFGGPKFLFLSEESYVEGTDLVLVFGIPFDYVLQAIRFDDTNMGNFILLFSRKLWLWLWDFFFVMRLRSFLSKIMQKISLFRKIANIYILLSFFYFLPATIQNEFIA